MSDGKYYEIHQKKVWEVFAYSESDAIQLVMDGKGILNEDELFVDKTSDPLPEDERYYKNALGTTDLAARGYRSYWD